VIYIRELKQTLTATVWMGEIDRYLYYTYYLFFIITGIQIHRHIKCLHETLTSFTMGQFFF